MNDIWSACAERWITEKKALHKQHNMQMRSWTFPFSLADMNEAIFLPIFIARISNHHHHRHCYRETTDQSEHNENAKYFLYMH